MSTTTTVASGNLLDPAIWTAKIFSTDGWVDAPDVVETREPATGQSLGVAGAADAETVAAAARDAAVAQREWAALSFEQRREVLLRAADLFAEHAEEIGGWIVRESGSIPPKAEVEIGAAIGESREGAALTSQPMGVLLPSPEPGRLSAASRVPIGVVGVIAPWNFPLTLAMRSVAPALALGNAVVLKSDVNTPVCGGVVIGGIFAEAGLPAGVLHVFTGGPETGEAMTADPNIAMISFTGSTAVGTQGRRGGGPRAQARRAGAGRQQPAHRARGRRPRGRRVGRRVGRVPASGPDLHDGRPSPRPREPVRVLRGPAHRAGGPVAGR